MNDQSKTSQYRITGAIQAVFESASQSEAQIEAQNRAVHQGQLVGKTYVVESTSPTTFLVKEVVTG